eukprot:COSAG02_NODE_8622_length_2502_cov_3.196837_1_plen_106_part_00
MRSQKPTRFEPWWAVEHCGLSEPVCYPFNESVDLVLQLLISLPYWCTFHCWFWPSSPIRFDFWPDLAAWHPQRRVKVSHRLFKVAACYASFLPLAFVETQWRAEH